MSRSSLAKWLSSQCVADAVANMRRTAVSFSLTNTTKQRVYRMSYERMKDAMLGKKYELSLVFVGEKRAKQLNHAYRKKSYTPNVLSFPLSKTCGEIFICPHVVRREAKDFGMSERNFTAYLFLHALLHLKGLSHGATMKRKEHALLRMFGIADNRS